MSEQTAPRVQNQNSLAARGLLIATVVVLSLLVFELACRTYAWLVVDPHFEQMLKSERLMLRASDNPVLGYENIPSIELTNPNGWRLHMNRYGLREDSDDLFADKHRIALLGDSATIGVGHSQETTISAMVQQKLDPAGERIKVLNFGVGGYSVEELEEQLRVKDAIYDVHEVVYLMHMNDFAGRNSVYEGADNGSYRMFHRPAIYGPWFLRKTVYRYKKASKGGSVGWYQWMFAGNEQRAYGHIAAMAAYTAEQNLPFSVLLMPSGLSFSNGEYALTNIADGLSKFLTESGIVFVSPVELFSVKTDELVDGTEHFTNAGNDLIATQVIHLMRRANGATPGA